MKKFNFKWLLLSIILSIASINSAWAVSFAKGETIYYNFTNITTQGGANWWNGSEQYDGNAQGTVKVVTFTSATSSTDGTTVMIKTSKGSWAELKSKSRSAGQNMLVVAADGKSYSWSTARTFKSGKKIYFKDHSSNMSTLGGSTHWKNADGNVYAKFWDGSNWTYSTYGNCVSGSWNGDNAVYELTVPGSGKTYTKVVFTRGNAGTDAGTWNSTAEQYPEIGQNLFTIADARADGSSIWIGSWSKYANEAAIIGSFNNWDPCEGMCSTGSTIRAIITLEAEKSYEFKVLEGGTYWGCDLCGPITNTTDAWQLYDSQNNLTITTGEAGEYCFHWDKTNNKVTVYYPQARLTKNKYIYFDVSNETYWNAAKFDAKFFFKYYDSGSDLPSMPLSCTTPLENYVYYAVVPDNDYVGQIQMNRYVNSAEDGIADVCYASSRTSSSQNCMTGQEGKLNYQYSWTPQWTTYCPPTTSETFANNETTVISWTSGNGTSGNPYLVKTGASIKATASASKTVNDGDMTVNYDFKVNGTSQQAGTSNTFSYTASANNTAYNVTMDAYTVYNLDGSVHSTKHTHATTLYYKALDTYSVTNTLTNISSNGRSGSDAAAYNIAYTATLSVGTGYNLPASITVKRGETTLTSGTHYSYNSSTGALTINAAQVTGNLTIIASGVAKTYSEENNLDKNTGDNHGTYTATFDATTIAIDPAPTKTNYHVDGYYLEAELSNRIADASGNLVAGVTKSAVNYTDGDGKWKKDGNVTLYTKWEENSFTVTVSAGDHGSVSTTSVTAHPITASSNFTVTANAGYAFSHWTFSEENQVDTNYVSTGGTNNATQTFNITATKAITMTANYVVRYGLYGSLDAGGDPAEGMPGWTVSADFSYSAGTYTISRTLTKPNTNYKFRILDRRNNFSYGCGSDYTFMKNDEATTLNSGNYNAYIATAGKGSHTLTVTEVNDGAYPAVTISSHPESYVVTLGVKAFTINDEVEGDFGGTVVATDAAGNTYASTKYIAKEETVEVEATPSDGYDFVGWWDNAEYSGDHFATANPTSWTVSGAVNAYAKFVEESTEVSGSGNWSAKVDGEALTKVVTIDGTITVDEAHAKAKRVILDQSADGKDGKLVITANKGLEVAEGIWVDNGSSLVAPTESDLILQSSSSGNASLIFNNNNEAQATVQMYSIGDIDGDTWNWQFMGTPFTSANALYSYYDAYLYEWKETNSVWGWDAVANGGAMTPFTGYCITQDAPTTYVMDGTLNPTTSKTLTVPAGVEMVFANSWSAPIDIGTFTDGAFDIGNKVVYLFNTGYAPDPENPAEQGTSAGQYIAVPIHASPFTGNELIAPMQGFYVDNTKGSAGSITMDYATVVRPTRDRDIVAGPMHAPKRMAAEADPAVMKIKATGSRYSDRVVILAREDFSTGFDNGWDGKNINEPGVAPIIYALRADGTKDAVSAIPTYEGTVVGFRQGEDNQYTFSFEYDGDEILYLNDLKQRAATLIDEEHTYTFTSAAGDAEARFTISATPIEKMPTGVDEIESGINVHKQMINGTLYIIRDGRIYNAEGALVK